MTSVYVVHGVLRLLRRSLDGNISRITTSRRMNGEKKVSQIKSLLTESVVIIELSKRESLESPQIYPKRIQVIEHDEVQEEVPSQENPNPL